MEGVEGVEGLFEIPTKSYGTLFFSEKNNYFSEYLSILETLHPPYPPPSTLYISQLITFT